MAIPYYQQLWTDVQEDLNKVLPPDLALVSMKRNVKNKNRAMTLVATTFIKYVQIVKTLDVCYDQALHPQKRLLIRRLLDLCTGRLLELKQELVVVDICDVSYLDKFLIEAKLTPFDLEIPGLRFCTMDREQELRERSDTINAIRIRVEEERREREEAAIKEAEEQARQELEDQKKALVEQQGEDEGIAAIEDEDEEEEVAANEGEEAPQQVEGPLTHDKAVLLIQRHERARQGRYEAVVWANVNKLKMKVAMMLPIIKPDIEVVERAVVLIQKVWRGYATRKKMHRDATHDALLLGMSMPSWLPTYALEHVKDVARLRRVVRDERYKEMEDAIAADEARFQTFEAPWLEDLCKDEVRDWFTEWYTKITLFPEIPPDEEGGSIKVHTHEAMTPEQYVAMVEYQQKNKDRIKQLKLKEQAEKKKKKAEARKLKKQKKAKEKAEKEKQKQRIKEGKENEEGFHAKPSKFLELLQEANEEYINMWKDKDENDNPEQRFEMNIIQDERHEGYKMEVRKVADAIMRLELDLLFAALMRDIAFLGGKKIRRKKPKSKGKKKRRGRKGKDMTRNRTTESLFDELVANNVIKNYPQIRMKDVLMDYSYSNYEYRMQDKNPNSGLAEVKEVVVEYCILPMASIEVHRIAPLTKSVCLFGPQGSGKRTLAYAVCTELGAVMFDLTPENLVGVYEGPKGLKMLTHLVEKMSRLLQPSIIFVDGAHKHFYKKVPPEEIDIDPKRYGSVIKTIAKNIKANDQVLVLGTSDEPWKASGPFTKAYQLLILVPSSDYGTQQMTWEQSLMTYHGVDREFPISALTLASRNYPPESIKKFMDKYMTVERILQMPKKPLTAEELFWELMHEEEEVLPEIMEKARKWYCSKSKMAKWKNNIILRNNGLLGSGSKK